MAFEACSCAHVCVRTRIRAWVCLKLPTCAPVNKCPKKRQKEKSDIWCQNVQRSPSKILPSTNIPCFFTMSWWFCVEVINLFLLRMFQFLTEIIY